MENQNPKIDHTFQWFFIIIIFAILYGISFIIKIAINAEKDSTFTIFAILALTFAIILGIIIKIKTNPDENTDNN